MDDRPYTWTERLEFAALCVLAAVLTAAVAWWMMDTFATVYWRGLIA